MVQVPTFCTTNIYCLFNAIATDDFQVSHFPEPRVAFDHKQFLFTPDSLTVAWNSKTCTYYHLFKGSVCDYSSYMAIINKTTIKNISLPSSDLIGETNVLLNITSFDVENNQCGFLETLQFKNDSELNNLINTNTHSTDCSHYRN